MQVPSAQNIYSRSISWVVDPDVCSKIHPFNRKDYSLPFTMLICTHSTQKADSMLFLNHGRKIVYKVPISFISQYCWPGHTLYFIPGTDGIYTLVHESPKGIKVPCCYDSPDCLRSRMEPNKKTLKVVEYLKDLGWEAVEAVHSSESKRVLDLVNAKINTLGWNGGRVYA